MNSDQIWQCDFTPNLDLVRGRYTLPLQFVGNLVKYQLTKLKQRIMHYNESCIKIVATFRACISYWKRVDFFPASYGSWSQGVRKSDFQWLWTPFLERFMSHQLKVCGNPGVSPSLGENTPDIFLFILIWFGDPVYRFVSKWENPTKMAKLRSRKAL